MSEAVARAAVLFSPPESWVKDIAPEPLPSDIKHKAKQGVFFRHVESQIRLTPGQRVWYSRLIKQVTDSSGLESVANFTLDFDPAYETLIIHHFHIRRGDQIIEVDAQKRMHLVRRERGFEASRLDGQWTWAISVPDLRVGDEIDVASSWVGAPPVLGDAFSAQMDMQWQQYCLCKYVRILSPVPLNWKPFPAGSVEPVIETGSDGYVEWLWRDVDVVPWVPENQMPEWFRAWRGFFVTSVQSWTQVADCYRPGYSQEALPDGLRQIADDIINTTPDPADRIIEALRYVQTHIRYFSVQMGAGGHVPRPLEVIFDDRMGDCKDVSKMLVAMLRHMDIDACPALVHTEFGPVLDQMPPGTNGFNHCIVRVRHQGRTLWLDATRYPQGGDIEHVEQAEFAFGLPLVEGGDLEVIEPKPTRLTYEVSEDITLKRRSKKNPRPSTVTISTTLRGRRADATRYSLQSDGLETFSQTYTDYYRRLYGEGVSSVPLDLVDDLRRNEIVIQERIELDDPWVKSQRSGTSEFVSPETLFQGLWGEGTQIARKWPFDIGGLRQVKVDTRLSLPFSIDYPPSRHNWDLGGIRGRSVTTTTNQSVHLVREYEVVRNHLTAEEKNRAEESLPELYANERIAIFAPEKELSENLWNTGFIGRHPWIIVVIIMVLFKLLAISGFLG
ncbi:MAG: DUF3857 domain-containing protein [Asticcacaulis sp.]